MRFKIMKILKKQRLFHFHESNIKYHKELINNYRDIERDKDGNKKDFEKEVYTISVGRSAQH